MNTTNKDRAERAQVAIDAYNTVGGEDESNMRDLLSDLMHLADANGQDFNFELETADMNYQAEFDEENEVES